MTVFTRNKYFIFATKSIQKAASFVLSEISPAILVYCFLSMKWNIFINILPNEVFPVAFAPIKMFTFLYLKFVKPVKNSFSMLELTIFLGYDKFIAKLLNDIKLSISIFITIIFCNLLSIISDFTK